MLSDTEAVLRKVCDFIEVDFDPSLLVLGRSTENLGDAAGLSGIMADNVAKYTTRLDPDSRDRIERVAGPWLSDLGYPVTYEGPAQRVSSLRKIGLERNSRGSIQHTCEVR